MKKLDAIICDVCRVILDGHNLFEKKQDHLVDVCIEHKEYAKTFLIDVVSENLGFKDIDKYRNCELCNKPITNDEVQNSLKKNSFHFLCKEHLMKYAKYFMLPNNVSKKHQYALFITVRVWVVWNNLQ